MITTIAFLLQQPFTARDFERFGIDLLRRNGFTVRIIDLSEVLYPHLGPGQVGTPTEGVTVVKSVAEATAVVAALRDPSVFVIALIGLAPASLWLFRAISEHRVPYAISRLGTVPWDRSSRDAGSRLRRLAALGIGVLPAIVRRLKLQIDVRRIAPPAHCLVSGTRSEAELQPAPRAARRIWVHALDYDRYLQNPDHPGTAGAKVVFLDQFWPFHPDFSFPGVTPPVTAARYHRSLGSFFDRLEAQLGAEVVVAAHPKADYGTEYFGGRQIVQGDTVELVRQARLVLAHLSTAINFAVLYRKPVVFLTTAELPSTGWDRPVHAFAEALGSPCVDIDGDLGTVPVPDGPDESRYRAYVQEYITTRPDDRRSTWQIVADELRVM